MKIMHQLNLGLALVFGLLAAMPLHAEILLSHPKIVDVTPSGFSVVWHADQASKPSIQIFEDMAGTIEVTSNYEVSTYPLQGLDPFISSSYDYQQSRFAFIDVMNSQGLMQLKVHGLNPGQTYYIKLHSDTQLDTGSWPASGTAAVTAQQENAWVLDARQLIISFSFNNAAGWPVVVSSSSASYPVSALIEDGSGPGQAAVNIANLFGFDGLNWASATTESLLIEVLKGNGEIASANVDVNLNTLFTVASNQFVNFETAFNGSLQMLSPDVKVYSQGDFVQLAWADEAPAVNGIISLYVDIDSLGLDGSLIATSINEDDDGVGDTYDWDVTSVSDGQYYVYATLSDGGSTISSYAAGQITIDVVGLDSDVDNMSDLWEQYYFETLSRDGSLDFDNDGRSDAQEYQHGTDPTVITGVTTPIIESPLPGTETDLLRPDLVVQNAAHEPGTVATYSCEVYTNQSLTELVEIIEGVVEGVNATTCVLVNDLADNTLYYWRARATVLGINSQWVNGSFFVNTVNDAPGDFNTSAPNDGADVATLQPVLEVLNSVDVDGDVLNYQFKVYSDSALTTLIITSPVLPQGEVDRTAWMLTSVLLENEMYYWFAVVTDEHGLQTQSNVASFTVNATISTPGLPTIASPLDAAEVTTDNVVLTVVNAIDQDGLALEYLFELDTVNSFDSAGLLKSDLIAETAVTTSWPAPQLLTENTNYYWRVMATNGTKNSGLVTAGFFYNTVNDAPTVPVVNNPDNQTWVEAQTPTLSVNPSTDPDEDNISYEFELYSDEQMTNLIGQSATADAFWTVPAPLTDNTWFYWRVRAIDEHALESGWTPLMSFFVNNTGFDDSPSITLIAPATDIPDASQAPVTITWTDDDPDSNAIISLYYDTDTAGVDGTLIVSDIEEDLDGTNDSYVWDAASLQPGSYYIYAVISDASSSSTVYLSTRITISEVAPGSPSITLIAPATDITDASQAPVTITWTDDDPDSNAIISLYYDTDTSGMDGTLIVTDIEEDLDGTNDSYVWDAASLQPGSYYIYAVISDASSSSTVYLSTRITIGGIAPAITLIAPATDIPDASQAPVTITWTDDDPDSNAIISLYYDTDTSGMDGTLIVTDIEEDLDGSNDSYVWDAASLQPGSYYIYAVISDASSSSTVYLPTRITIAEIAPPVSNGGGGGGGGGGLILSPIFLVLLMLPVLYRLVCRDSFSTD